MRRGAAVLAAAAAGIGVFWWLLARVGLAAPGGTVVSSVRTPVPVVALTFDDGPNGATAGILALLRARGEVATFFVTCREAERRPELVRAIAAAGGEVANHTYSHARLAGRAAPFIDLQVQRCGQVLRSLTGGTVRLFRFPYLAATPAAVDEVRRLGYTVVGASVDPQDWREPGADAIAARVAFRVRAGDIVLLHDRRQTLAALPLVLDALRLRGLRTVTVGQLLRLGGGR